MSTFELYSQTIKKVITILTKEDKRGRIVSLVDIACERESVSLVDIACERESVSLVDIASHITVEGDTKRVIRHFYDISISLLKKSSST